MRCVNCQIEVNVGAIVCSWCRFSPFLFGYGPYDGGSNGIPHPLSGRGGGDSLFGLIWHKLFGPKPPPPPPHPNYTAFIFGQDAHGHPVCRCRCTSCGHIKWPDVYEVRSLQEALREIKSVP
jgi:hypothetical protein